jgi:hypothetical protein
MKKPSLILGSRYASSDEAIAPLRSAVPWAKHISGDVLVPESRLRFRLGEGKGRLLYRLIVQVKKEEKGFVALAILEPFTMPEILLAAAVAALAFTVIGMQMPGLLFVFIPLWLLSIAVHAYRKLKSSDDVLRQIAALYEPNQSLEPTAPSGRGSS